MDKRIEYEFGRVKSKIRVDEALEALEACYNPILCGYLVLPEIQKELIDAYREHKKFKKRKKY